MRVLVQQGRRFTARQHSTGYKLPRNASRSVHDVSHSQRRVVRAVLGTHLKRLVDSVAILYNSNPQLLFGPNKTTSLSLPSLSSNSPLLQSEVRELVNRSMKRVLPIALNERSEGEELSITALVSGNLEKLSENESEGLDHERFGNGVFDVSIYIGTYVPTVFGIEGNGAHLAVVGRGRDDASAKYSDWVRIRKSLERLRPPNGTELLLSNDGDRILEGTVSNFFVVCRKDNDEAKGQSVHCFEVQTAPIIDHVLPGIIRQLVIEVCLSKGIPFREVAPSWSESEFWAEAFITSSLRLLQHAETISFPSSWESLNSKSWEEISWKDKHFEEGPGMVTTIIQKEVMEKAASEGWVLFDDNIMSDKISLEI
ncbi:D-aminoacid aminotransferase-like PLP-dependent enzymes superfamily protein [Prunus dulcis]|uniref:D-aminoacid aminotransferase-like PLP-dependent enzymes superfamily protein n=1 Tax=Prunus dulcis TaxID=3755 RepID=A0A4Y1R199_PRUDU|nr:D-aminoacid aminotransferase-like PLP-dependent enzymes superfamily protein [Prunus dulcis]